MKKKQLQQARTLYALRHYRVQQPAKKDGGSNELKTVQKLKSMKGGKNHNSPKFVDWKLNNCQLSAVQRCHEFGVVPALFSIKTRFIKGSSHEPIINAIKKAFLDNKTAYILSIDDENFDHKMSVVRSLGLKVTILKYRIYF